MRRQRVAAGERGGDMAGELLTAARETWRRAGRWRGVGRWRVNGGVIIGEDFWR